MPSWNPFSRPHPDIGLLTTPVNITEIFFFYIFVPNRFLILYSIDLYRVPDHRRMPRTPTNIWIYALGGERERDCARGSTRILGER